MTGLPRRLPARAVEVLESIYQHRLLSTAQLNRLHTPDATPRTTQRLLTTLADEELVAWARGVGRTKLWYLTERGADAVETIPSRGELRRKVVTPAQAAGQLQQHTLAVNDVGVAYLQAARERGDEFGPLSWRHEVAHPIGGTPGRRGGEQLITDALLTYLQTDDDRVVQHQRFIELDRGTIPIDALLAKLHRYQRLRDYTPDARPGHDARPAWRSAYPARLPETQIILAHKPRPILEHRQQLLFALAASDPDLHRDQQLRVAVVLLEDLQQHGPYAAIWLRLDDPSRRVDWLATGRSRR
jgi:hypothetical protein